MFTNYKIIRNSKGQFILKTSFWSATKYHAKQVFRIMTLSTLTAYVLIVSSMALNLNKLFTAQISYAQAIVEKPNVELPPILKKICKAESGNQQFKKNGDVIRGIVNPSDIGYCQINEYIWNDTARKLGYDIYTEEGNKEMALYIFNLQGTDPWNSSKAKWSK